MALLFLVSAGDSQAQSTEKLNASPFKTICDIEDEEAIERNRKIETIISQSGLQVPAYVRSNVQHFPALKPRKPHQKLKDFSFDKNIHAGIIDVKFVEGSDVKLENGMLVSGNKKFKLDQINDTLEKNGMTIRPLFTRPPEELKADKACGERRDGEELDDLTLWFEISTSEDDHQSNNFDKTNSAINRLNALGLIEFIAFRSRPALLPRTDIAPPTANHTGLQNYLLSPTQTPTGIDSNFAFALGAQGRGQNAKLMLIGGGIRPTHEDLNEPFIQILNHALASQQTPEFEAHDTAALGVVVADADNGVGIRGIAPYAGYSFVSTDYTGSHNPANAMSVAGAREMNIGDVMLLEFGWCRNLSAGLPDSSYSVAVGSGNSYSKTNFACMPPDEDPARFAAIKSLTSLGIVVVSTAHNSDVNLDHAVFNGRYDSSHPNFVDSGAILVGAKLLNGTRASFSNYGSRIDVSAQGEAITTITTSCFAGTQHPDTACISMAGSAGDPDQRYTNDYGGTSGAGPIVAGAALVIQSLQKARGGAPILPRVMRQLFRSIGTAQTGGAAKSVGKTPNLKTIYEWMTADDDGDGVANIDELVAGRNPSVDERLILTLLLNEEQ